MKTILVEQFGGPEVLQVVERPDPVAQAGQVLVDIQACGLNFADIMARAGQYPPLSEVPLVPGFEVAGVVAEVGEGVEGFSVGDRVMGMMFGGGYTSKAALDAAQAIKLPQELDFAPATALLVQGLTAYFLLEEARLQAGETVLIPSAAGGVGSLAIQIAKLKGAGKVIGLASPSKHGRVRELGADYVFDYNTAGWFKDVLEATGEAGVDVYLDSQGDLSGEGVETLGQGARWMVFGGQASGEGVLSQAKAWEMLFKNITLRGYAVYHNTSDFPRALAEMIGWVSSGQLQIESSSRFALQDAAGAHRAVEERKTSGKVVLEP